MTSQENSMPTEEQVQPEIQRMLRSRCLVIVDKSDGATIVLEPEQTEKLRQWLVEYV